MPLQAKVSRKRWANLRSDIAAAIAASGLQPMLKTSDVEPDQHWERVLESAKDRRISNGLSRLARWATLRQITPKEVNDAVLAQFFSELETGSLVRNLQLQRRNVAKLWNKLATILADRNLGALRSREERYLAAGAVARTSRLLEERGRRVPALVQRPDPLEENARARALAPETLRLRRHNIHLATSAACYGGIDKSKLTSLSRLVEPDIFRAILRQQWEKNGGKLSSHLVGLANVLITLAAEWVRAPSEQIAELKKLRSKLGSVRRGLTDKNRNLLRKFDDPRLLGRLVDLPDQLWRIARRKSTKLKTLVY